MSALALSLLSISLYRTYCSQEECYIMCPHVCSVLLEEGKKKKRKPKSWLGFAIMYPTNRAGSLSQYQSSMSCIPCLWSTASDSSCCFPLSSAAQTKPLWFPHHSETRPHTGLCGGLTDWFFFFLSFGNTRIKTLVHSKPGFCRNHGGVFTSVVSNHPRWSISLSGVSKKTNNDT